MQYIAIIFYALGQLVLPTDIEAIVNTERTAHDLPALRSNITLRESACAKAHDMADKRYFAHTAPDGTEPWDHIKQAGYAYSFAGENLARHYDGAGTVQAWMNSPTHRDNVLGDFQEQGICKVDIYTVQHLGKR